MHLSQIHRKDTKSFLNKQIYFNNFSFFLIFSHLFLFSHPNITISHLASIKFPHPLNLALASLPPRSVSHPALGRCRILTT